MKHNSSHSIFLLIFFAFILTTCKKEDDNRGTCVDGIQNQGETGVDCGGPCTACNTTTATIPIVSTMSVSSITATKAETGGTVISAGNAYIISAGVCFSIAPNPTIADALVNDYPLPDFFTCSLTGLNIGTTYYVKAFVINSAGIGYGNEVSFTTASTLAVGDIYAGGFIFYLDSTQIHGYVCAEFNQGNTEWSCFGTNVSAALGTAVGTGQANTSAIVAAACGGVAANICSDLVLNGYSDWFLPSREELRLMAFNLAAYGMGNFATDYYWSSSQINSLNVYAVSFLNGTIISNSKNNHELVRAVRAF
jgi:hypothetical protein